MARRWPASNGPSTARTCLKPLVRRAVLPHAGVAELADARDLQSWVPQGACGFDSHPRQSVTTIWPVSITALHGPRRALRAPLPVGVAQRRSTRAQVGAGHRCVRATDRDAEVFNTPC